MKKIFANGTDEKAFLAELSKRAGETNKKVTETVSAIIEDVKENGDTVLQKRGVLTDPEIAKIQAFIKKNYKEMYLKWAENSDNGFYEK